MAGKEEALSSSAWWKQYPQLATSPVTVKTVLTLFHSHGQALLDGIPAAPFSFSDLALCHVDGATSTIITAPDGITRSLKLQLTPPQSVVLQDVFGLGSRSMTSLTCSVSSQETKLQIDAQVCAEPVGYVTLTILPLYPIQHYLSMVQYSGTYDNIPIIQVLSSMIGESTALNFFADLPIAFCSAIELPSFLIDISNTTIDLYESPFGVEVSQAVIHLQIDNTLQPQLGGIQFGVQAASIHVTRSATSGEAGYDSTLSVTLTAKAGSNQLSLTGILSRSSEGPYSLTLKVTGGCNLQAICTALNVGGYEKLSPPLSEESFKPTDTFGTIGCTFMQTSQGQSSSFKRTNIFFGLEYLQLKPWDTLLPTGLQPATQTKASVVVILEGNPMAVGLNLSYRLPVSAKFADILVGASVAPIRTKQDSKSPIDTYAVTLSMHSDPSSKLPTATLDAFLTTLTLSKWASVTDAIPFLKKLGDDLAIVSASVEVTLGITKPYKPRVSAWALRAQLPKSWTLLKTPKVAIAQAKLDLSWSSVGWQCEIGAFIMFGAAELKCSAELKMPSKDSMGYFRFKNLSDAFTFGAFVKEMGVDPKSVPLLDSSTLSNARLSLVSLHIINDTKGGLAITAFEVQLAWDSQKIGQLQIENSTLLISWYRDALSDKSTGNSAGNWSIDWEGYMTNKWFITAKIQYITTTKDSNASGLALAGEILDMSRQRQVSTVVDSLTSNGGTSSPQVNWSSNMPPTVKSGFILDRLRISATLGKTPRYAVAAGATWGQSGVGSAMLIVEKATSTATSWDFIFAIRVKSLNLTDIFVDSALAKDIGTQLIIKNAYILAFHYASPTNMFTVEQKLTSLGAWNYISSAHGPGGGSLVDSNQKAATESPLNAGFTLAADLNFTSAPEGTSFRNLVLISSSPTKLPTTLKVACVLQKEGQNWNDIVFMAQLRDLELSSSITLQAGSILYRRKTLPLSPSAKATNPLQYDHIIDLAAICHLKLSPTATPWDLGVNLSVSSTQASLTTTSATDASKKYVLAELGKLQLTKLELSITYLFANAAPDQPLADNEVSQGSKKASWNIKVKADVKVGGIVAELGVQLGKGMVPQVLTITPPTSQPSTTVMLSSFMNDIVGTDIPKDLLDVTLSEWELYYAWKETPRVSPTPYKQGLVASAKAVVYDVPFVVSAGIYTADNNQNGFFIETTKSDPIEFGGIIFHGGIGKETSGPSFSISAQRSGKGCSLAGGITLFGSADAIEGGLTVNYIFNDKKFTGDLAVKASFVPTGKATIKFEVAEGIDHKMHFRFVDLPGVFEDALKVKDVIDAIKELSRKDKCGMLALALKQEAIKTKVTAKISLSPTQPPRVKGQPYRVSLLVKGKFQLEIIKVITTAEVDFNEFPLTVQLPEKMTIGAFAESFVMSLAASAVSVVEGLYNNPIELAKVIGTVVLKDLAIDLLAAYLCRGFGRKPDDPPKPDQKPPPDDKGPGGGDGPGVTAFLLFLGAAFATGLAIALNETKDAVTLGYVAVSTIAPLIFETATPGSGTGPQPEPRPEKPDLSTLDLKDPFQSLISRTFTRWTDCKDFSSALKTVAQCGREYRNALSVLRKALNDSSVVSKLGQSQLATYTSQRMYLVSYFSTLGTDFGHKWLTIDSKTIIVELIPAQKSMRVTWATPQTDKNLATAVTVRAGDDNKEVIEPRYYANNTMVIPWSKFAPDQKISVKVAAFVLVPTVSDPEEPVGLESYNFFASGPPAETRIFTVHSPMYSGTQGTPFDDSVTVSKWNATEDIQLDPSTPIDKIDVFTAPFDASSNVEGVTGLAVTYKTQPPTKAVSYGNTTTVLRKTLTMQQPSIIVGVVGKVCAIPGKPGQKAITQLAFLLFDSKNGQARVEGPFGSVPKDSGLENFSFSGQITAPFAQSSDAQGSVYGLVNTSIFKLAFGEPASTASPPTFIANWPSLGSPQIDTSSPVEKIVIFTQPFDSSPDFPVHGLTGLIISYRTTIGLSKAVSHGNTSNTALSTVSIPDSSFITGVVGKICPLPGKPGETAITQLLFLIFDSKTGQSRVEGPFGWVPKDSTSQAFAFNGPMLSLFGKEINHDQANPYGLRALGVTENYKRLV